MPATATPAPPGQSRQLPGIRFDTAPTPPPEVLPRMDIAAFVGIAASGPVGVPIPIEDPARFADIFGEDAPLAWDPVRSEQTYALLAPAVRAFFRNGGQRCWVVRVARADAETDTFQVPGLAAISAGGTIGPAAIRARSPGTWADTLQLSAFVDATPIQVLATGPGTLMLATSGPAVAAGDVLRLGFGTSTLLLAVDAVTPANLGSPPDAAPASIAITVGAQLLLAPATIPPGSTVQVAHAIAGGVTVTALASSDGASPADGTTELSFDPPLGQAPAPGELVTAQLGGDQLLLEIVQARATSAGVTAILCSAVSATVPPAGAAPPAAAANEYAEVLTLQLRVDGGAAPLALSGIGLAPAHPAYIGLLPDDPTLFAVDPSGRADPSPLASPVPPALAAAVSAPRFPLAGPVSNPWALPGDDEITWCVPLGAAILAGPTLGAGYSSASTRARDGLHTFDAGLFLDPALASVPANQLLDAANRVRYGPASTETSDGTNALAGMHALLENEEISLFAVPDAVLRNWSLETAATPAPTTPPAPATQPDFSRFIACSTRVPATPTLSITGEPGAVNHVSWTETDVADATYVLERSTDPSFADPDQVYSGPDLAVDLGWPPNGATYYVRVQAIAGGLASAWSVTLRMDAPSLERWLLDDPILYTPAAMLAIQSGALQMCAARGDLFAMLALPEHYRPSDANAHVAALKGASPASDPVFSYGALYTPWLYTAEPDDPSTIRRLPADGAAVGVAAQRSAQRGPWIAPANQPLVDVVDLDPAIPPSSYQALFDAQVNVVRQDPGGFLALAADTLSDDPDLTPISVRRLLCQLRRTAQRYGSATAFATNDARTRRTAVRTFERLLGQMFLLGAFTGATAAEGFQVSTPFTQQDLDDGTLIVELRVAPSQPLQFLTVLLVRSGTGGLTVQSR